jgi:hypothetical protein
MTDQLSYAEKFAATGKHKICADAVTAICRVLSLKIHSLSNLPASILCNTAPETSFAWHEDKKHWQYKLVFLIGEVSLFHSKTGTEDGRHIGDYAERRGCSRELCDGSIEREGPVLTF